MDERQKIEWALQAKKLIQQLEKRQAFPTLNPYSMAKLVVCLTQIVFY
jgi:hypothetical protein